MAPDTYSLDRIITISFAHTVDISSIAPVIDGRPLGNVWFSPTP